MYQHVNESTHVVIHHLRDPFTISIEHKPIHANLCIASHAQLLNQTRLVTQSTQGSHEPAITVSTLPHVISSGAVDVELRLVEDVGDSLGALRFEIQTRGRAGQVINERVQEVIAAKAQVSFNIEMRVAVLFVDATAFFDDFVYLGTAESRCFLVGCLHVDGGGGGLVGGGGSFGSIWVVRDDASDCRC